MNINDWSYFIKNNKKNVSGFLNLGDSVFKEGDILVFSKENNLYNDKGIIDKIVNKKMDMTILESQKIVNEDIIKYSVSENASLMINKAIKNGNKIIAVGIEVGKVLESIYENNKILPCSGITKIAFNEKYRFELIDGIIVEKNRQTEEEWGMLKHNYD